MLQIKNIYDFYDKQSSKQKHHIFTNSKEFLEGGLKEDIKNLCIYIWENPSIMISLIKNLYNKDLLDNLIQLITSRFYQNFFCHKILEPQLFYIISYFLKEEINKLTLEKKVDFMKKSICHKIFKQLRRNPEMVKYFKQIVKDIVNYVYFHSQSKNNEMYNILLSNKIYLSISLIEEKINEERKSKEKNKKTSKNIIEKNIDKNIDISKYDEISKKYFQNITKNFLEEKKEEYSINNDKNNILMKEYIEFQLNSFNNFTLVNKGGELYTNKNLLKHISSSSIKEVDIIYKRNICLALNFMDKFLNIINEKINEIPYQIRQICKIIELLVKQKFPQIKKFEINSIIGIFFFEKLLFPFIISPQINSILMTSKYLSKDLYYNLLALTRYLKCFFFGYFYFEYNDECDYTPFNYYFIEKMPLLNEIFDKICDVEIPDYIQKLIFEENNEANINFKKYNEQYSIYHHSFCLSIGDLSIIMKNMYMNRNELFENDKNVELYNIWDKIFKNKLYKDSISGKALKENPIIQKCESADTSKKSHIDKDAHQIYEFMNNIGSKPKIVKEYFIINHTVFNTQENDYHEITSLDQKVLNFDINDNNIDIDLLKILKKSFCDILNNLPSIDELISLNQINIKNIKDFNTFLIELKKYFNYYYFDHMDFDQTVKSIELKWAINFFSENENKISENLKSNNYALFFTELEKDLNNSIKEVNNNFSFISHFHYNNIDILKKMKNISYTLNKLKKISLNFIVQNIIHKFSAYIQVSVKAVKNKNKNPKNIWSDLVFEIKRGKNKDDKCYDMNNIYISEKNNYINYKTIESFIDNFKFENEHFKGNENKDENNNIFDYMSELKIPEKINTFLDVSLKEILIEKIFHNIYSKQDVPNISSKIKNIILSGLYDNIYKNYIPSSKDDLLYKKCLMLSWTNLSHFTNEEFPLQQSLIPSIIDCLKKLQNKKIPKKKLSYLIKINEILSTIHCNKQINFNNKKLNNIYYLNPFLVYSIIKAKLRNLPSDIRYIEVFMDEKDKEFKYIQEMQNIILFIIDITHKDLFGNISEEEYNINCNMNYNK